MALTTSTIVGYAAEVPTNNATVNAVVKELYLNGNENTIASLLANKATVIIKHYPTPDTDHLFIGIATNAGWTDQSVICACQFDPQAARDALVLPMVPKNNSGVQGYMVLDFPVETNGAALQWQDIAIYAKNIELTGSVTQLQCWPTIAAWFENGYICVDQVNGKDYNTGTERFPLASMDRAKNMFKRIKLKRSQRYYGKLVLEGYEIGAYGQGNAPELCGMMIPAKKTNWKAGIIDAATKGWKENPNGKIWRLEFLDNNTMQGYRPTDMDDFNIGTIVNKHTGQTLNCRKCHSLQELNQNFDIYQNFSGNDSSVFRYLYLFLNSGTPNNNDWAFTAGSNGIEMKNSSIRDIAVRYWGKHGIAVSSNCLIENCEVDCIGGSQMPASNPTNGIAYGNGIEIWINANTVVENVTVRNCRITRCYDAGLTFQGQYNPDKQTGQNNEIKPNAINILFVDNYVSNCGYGLEIWDMPTDGHTHSGKILKNCRITHCTFSYCGYNTGFRYLEPNDGVRLNCLIYNAFRKKVDCVIDNCVFEYAPIYVFQKALENMNIEVTIDKKIYSYPIEAQTVTFVNNKINLMYNANLMYAQFKTPTTVCPTEEGIAQYRQVDADTTSTISVIGKDGTIQVFGPVF